MTDRISGMANPVQARTHRPEIDNIAPCMFWKLPLEVRDMIYELVYGEHRVIKAKPRFLWAPAEQPVVKVKPKILRGPDSDETFIAPVEAVPTPFPNSILSCMLVSKSFLDEAAKVFFRTKTIHFSSPYCIAHCLQNGCPVNCHLLRHAKSIQVDRISIGLGENPLRSFPALRSLQVEFWPSDLDLEERFPLHDALTDLDLVGIPSIIPFLEIRGLQEFVAINALQYSGTPQWSKLVEQIGALLSAVTTKLGGPNEGLSSIPTVIEILATNPPVKRQASELASDPIVEESPAVEDPLKGQELPHDEAEFVRLFFNRPHAMYKWCHEAAHHLNNCSAL